MWEQIQVSEWIVRCQRSLEMHQASMLSPYHFTVVLDAVSELTCEGVVSELLYADDLVLMSESVEGCWNKFMKWKEAFGSKGMKVNLGKDKVVVSGSITMDGLSKGNVDPCGVCSLRVKANSVLCVQCDM